MSCLLRNGKWFMVLSGKCSFIVSKQLYSGKLLDAISKRIIYKVYKGSDTLNTEKRVKRQ